MSDNDSERDGEEEEDVSDNDLEILGENKESQTMTWRSWVTMTIKKSLTPTTWNYRYSLSLTNDPCSI